MTARAAGFFQTATVPRDVVAISVYLVNALVPKDQNIKIAKQNRDALQKNYHLEFGVSLVRP